MAYLRLISQGWVEELQFSADGIVIVDRVGTCSVNDVHQNFGALTMPQKFMT